jgi:hypothetical protein
MLISDTLYTRFKDDNGGPFSTTYTKLRVRLNDGGSDGGGKKSLKLCAMAV